MCLCSQASRPTTTSRAIAALADGRSCSPRSAAVRSTPRPSCSTTSPTAGPKSTAGRSASSSTCARAPGLLVFPFPAASFVHLSFFIHPIFLCFVFFLSFYQLVLVYLYFSYESSKFSFHFISVLLLFESASRISVLSAGLPLGIASCGVRTFEKRTQWRVEGRRGE